MNCDGRTPCYDHRRSGGRVRCERGGSLSGASHLCPSSVRPSFRRRFARPPSVWKRKDASACSTTGEGRWWRSCRRSAGLRLLWCKRARVHRSNVNGNGAFLRSSSHEATEVLLRWGKDGPRRRRRAEGRSRRSVPWTGALGERRGGDRERDLVAQGEGERAADMHTARRNGRASEGRKCRDRSGRSLPSRLRLCNTRGAWVYFSLVTKN